MREDAVGERANFYGLLDSVRFAADSPHDQRRRRELEATGAIMIDVLVGSAVPVLSHAQAYDSAPLLDLLQEADGDATAFADLVEDGAIRVVLPPDDGIRLIAGEDEDSLVNRFAVALRQRDYVFSGWPQLAEGSARAAVLDVLQRGAAVDGRLGDRDLEARVDGLRLLDAAVRSSRCTERADPLGQRLPTEVAAAARRYAADSLEGGDGQWLAASVEQAASGPDRVGRSQIYGLLRRRRDETGHELTCTALTSLVDGVYNGLVAESVRATGSLRTCATQGVADALAGLTDDAHSAQLAVDLAVDPRHETWLRWRDIHELSTQLRRLTVGQRLRHLERLHVQGLHVEPEGPRLGRWSVPVDARRGGGKLAAEGTVGLIACAVGGGVPGALVSAGLKAAGSVAKGRWDRRQETRAAQAESAGERRGVASGTAAWRDGLHRAEPVRRSAARRG